MCTPSIAAFCISLFIAVALPPVYAQETSDDLIRDCKAKIAIFEQPSAESSVLDLTHAAACQGFILGFESAAAVALVKGANEELLGFCFPGNVKLVQAAKVFVKYAEAQTGELNVEPGILFYRSLVSAFPCAKPKAK